MVQYYRLFFINANFFSFLTLLFKNSFIFVVERIIKYVKPPIKYSIMIIIYFKDNNSCSDENINKLFKILPKKSDCHCFNDEIMIVTFMEFISLKIIADLFIHKAKKCNIVLENLSFNKFNDTDDFENPIQQIFYKKRFINHPHQ